MAGMLKVIIVALLLMPLNVFSEGFSIAGVGFKLDKGVSVRHKSQKVELTNKNEEYLLTLYPVRVPEGESTNEIIEKDGKEKYIKKGVFYLNKPSTKISTMGYIYKTTWLGYTGDAVWLIEYSSNSKEVKIGERILFGILEKTFK